MYALRVRAVTDRSRDRSIDYVDLDRSIDRLCGPIDRLLGPIDEPIDRLCGPIDRRRFLKQTAHRPAEHALWNIDRGVRAEHALWYLQQHQA